MAILLSIWLIIRSGLNDAPPPGPSWRSVAGDGAAAVAVTVRGSSVARAIVRADVVCDAAPAFVAVRAIAVAMRLVFTEWSGSGPGGAEGPADATDAGTR
jgi:hypothetical protein